jgi:serine/threonine-protein kinase
MVKGAEPADEKRDHVVLVPELLRGAAAGGAGGEAMTLAPGVRLGTYEVLSPIGAGGMGEVYRARDAKLGRDVALKVLPAALASDPDRMARFQREAHVLASLNHPHIASIYGLEDSDTTRALVMELVEGPTLAEGIGKRAVPLEEALPIARQIAEALEYAHERGIVHRDLKPANVKLTAEGAVKVLDFGLAKALSDEPVPADVSQSPTLSAVATRAGIILGTAAYMSPEQAKGKAADRRSDIWSFGVVLFEMLSGRRLFSGETTSDTLAAVLRQEIDWTALPASTPLSMRRLLERCLDRDPKQRLQAIGEARVAMERPLGAPDEARVASTVPLWRRAVVWATAGGVLGAALVLGFREPQRSSPPPALVRMSAELGADASLFTDWETAANLSPDGATLAFVATNTSGTRQLYLRRLDELRASPLPGTDGASGPFFAPDGLWVAFFAGGKLKRVSVKGGAAVTVCDAEAGSHGGTWAKDGTIVFQPTGGRSLGWQRVSSTGGTPEPIATPEPGEVIQRFPQVLPGGQALLYTSHNSRSGFDNANLVVKPLPKGTRKVVQRGAFSGRYLESGHLVFIREGTLFAAPFDLDRLELMSPPVPVLEGVAANPNGGWTQFALSSNGTMVYLPGSGAESKASIHWMTAEGATTPLRAAPANWSNPSFSPDGRRLAMQIHDGRQEDVWVYEWARDTMARVTFDDSDDGWPAWTPDGRRIAFSSTRGDKAEFNIYWQRVDGTGEVERLTESKNTQWTASWHPSGRFLAFVESVPRSSGLDIMILPMEGDEASGWKPGKPTAFLNTSFRELEPRFSPDGQWLAYESNESGRNEAYVRPFPGPGGKSQISIDGGRCPMWSRTRRELFYITSDQRIMVVPYTTQGDSFGAEKPRLWSEGRFRRPRGLTWRPLELHPDAQRFALALPAEAETVKQDKVVFVFNFFEELRRVVPVGTTR